MSSNGGLIDGLLGIVRENFLLVASLAAGSYYAIQVGYIDAPTVELPDGSMVVATGIVAAAIGGHIAAGKIYDLLPEEEGIYLIAFKSSDEAGGEVWELSEDQFADMDVVNGTLFQWPVSKRVYECREYDRGRNVAVGNWRESVAGSQLAGDSKVVDAFAAIEELRSEFEPAAQRARFLQRRLRGIARKADERRLEDQQALLDETLTPAFEDDGATISSILREELPDELLPDSMQADTMKDIERAQAERNGHQEGEHVGFDLLDDGEALERNTET